MKICPTCQSSYPNGFKYCPQDNSTLMANEEFKQRATPEAAPVKREVVIEESQALASNIIAEEKNVPVAEPASIEFIPEPPAPYIAPREILQRAKTEDVAVAAPPKISEKQAESVTAPAANGAASRATNGAAQSALAIPSSPKLNNSNDLKLTIPESSGLLSSLFGALKGIRDINFFGSVKAGAGQDFNVLIPDESLITRIVQEVVQTLQDFQRNPKQFIGEFVRGEGANLRRRNAMLAGSEMAIIGYGTLYLCFQAVTLLGKDKPQFFNALCLAFVSYLVACYAVRGFLLHRIINKFTSAIALPKLGLELATWLPVLGILAFVWFSPTWFCLIFPGRCYADIAKEEQYRLLAPTVTTDTPKVEKQVQKVQKEIPKGKGGFTGGAKLKVEQAHGGGGNHDNTPATKGTPPLFTNNPIPLPKTTNHSTLVRADTMLGDPTLNKPRPGPIGLENGVDAPLPSKGTGGGNGIGSGKGDGKGPGEGGNTGGGRNSVGGGDGDGGSGGIFQATASLKPTITFREKARYTEQARQNRVQGSVLVTAIFTADGRVTAIRVTRGLPDGLNEEAIKAAQKIRFTPAMKNGQPVAVRMQMEFTFNLL